MANAIINMARLARAGFTLSYYGVELMPEHIEKPWPVKLYRVMTFPIRAVSAIVRAPLKKQSTAERLVTALTRLGPTYIKLGQFLATRGDIVGKQLANDLSALQDRLPPFSQKQAIAEVERQLGMPIDKIFVEFGPPIAAASIAQVHKAIVKDEEGIEHQVAVKILRPGIEKRFQIDQEAYAFAARMVERLSEPARRLRPVEVVKTLDRSMEIELDLRLEAAAMSEMTDNTLNDPGFRIPGIDWTRTTQRMLTTEWVDGIPIAQRDKLIAGGHDVIDLGTRVLQNFLRQAMRDGFFHADMHPGNLFIDPASNIVAVDFGIMGRLSAKEQHFLAEILYGFITRDYKRAAQVHFDAGYVPKHHSVELFAQGLRAIGEPIADKTADQVSMAKFLGQLFDYTAVFDMATRPELIMLQKNLVVAEGVARDLNPELNMWRAAEPVVKEWMQSQIGPQGKLRLPAQGAEAFGVFMRDLPHHLEHAAQGLKGLSEMQESGMKVDQHSLDQLAKAQSRNNRITQLGIWVAALSLLALAVKQYFL